jgi:hypothetical protein
LETINNIELKDKNVYPDETVLRSVLDQAYSAYAKLLEFYDQNEMVHEWRYYHDGKAWLCRVSSDDLVLEKRLIRAQPWLMEITFKFP